VNLKSIVEEAGHNFCIQAVRLSFPDGGEYLFGENHHSDIIAETASAIKRAFKFTKIVEPRQRIIQCGLPLALREIVDIILHSQKFQRIRNSLVPVAEAEIIARRAVVFQHRIPVKPCLKAHGIRKA